MCPGLLVKRFGCQVDAVGPDEGSRLGVYGGLSQVGRVVQRFKDTCPVLSGEVDVTDCAVAEQDPEHVITDHGDARHYWQVVLAHIAILREGRDDQQRLVLPGAFPVVHDLLASEDGPFTDELGGARLQTSSKHRSVHRDRRATASMVGMEVGYGVADGVSSVG